MGKPVVKNWRLQKIQEGSGFTITELLVAMAILSVIAAIAVPTLTRDNTEARFNGLVRRLAIDLERAKYEAASSPEDRAILIPNSQDRYSMSGVLPGTTTYFLVNQHVAPEHYKIYGVLKVAADPNTSYTPPDGTSLPAEIRFLGTGSIQVSINGDALTDSSASIFLKTSDDSMKMRIIVYQATGLIRVYQGW